MALSLQASGGAAVEVSTPQAQQAQHDLGKLGYYVELSSAASLAGLRELVRSGQLGPTERIVLIATSHGYKEMPMDK